MSFNFTAATLPVPFGAVLRRGCLDRANLWCNLTREETVVKKKRPVALVLIAILQFLSIAVLPPRMLSFLTRPVVIALFVAVFAFLAWALLTFRPLGRTLTIVVQGFNILVRVLITLAKVVPSKVPGTPADVQLLVTSLVSIALSVLILLYVDQPEMQLLFES